MADRVVGRVKITKTPTGEAPDWVREAWVGLTLSCYPNVGYSSHVRGELTNEQVERRCGVTVPQIQALAALAEHNPEAAMWWNVRGFPQAFRHFFFGIDEIDIISGFTWKPLLVADDMETGRFELPGR